MCADVWMFSTLMTPARLTAALPLKPKLMPKAPTLSLLFAVTATPRKLPVCSAITRGPSALASPDGVLPDGTMLCDLPAFGPGSVRSITCTLVFAQSESTLCVTAPHRVVARRILVGLPDTSTIA